MPVTNYFYDGDSVLLEYDELGVTQKTYTRTPDGGLLSEFDGTSTKHYEMDGLGSTEALTDDSQTVTDRWTYRAFGSATQALGTDITPYLFVGGQGYQHNRETDLYLLGARYYDPATATFLSSDPSGFASGDPNLYRYAANNPIRFVDPSGLMTVKYLGMAKAACGKMSNTDWDFILSKKTDELPVGTSYFIVQRIYIAYNRTECPCDVAKLASALLSKVADFYEAWYVPANSKVVDQRTAETLRPTDYTDRNGAFAKSGTCGYEFVHGEARLFKISGKDRPDEDPTWKQNQVYKFAGYPDTAASPFSLYSREGMPPWWSTASVKDEAPGYHSFSLLWSCCCDPPDEAKGDSVTLDYSPK